MTYTPTKAFILAAGKGERMRPLTDTCPKPLLSVAGKPMIDRALDALVRAGVTDCVINTGYLAEQIETHLQNRTDIAITFSREDDLLETGGGVKKALDFFEGQPFYVLNGDVIWTDHTEPALLRLAAHWDGDAMDACLLMYDKNRLPDYKGKGDYFLNGDHSKLIHVSRCPEEGAESANTIFAGPRIVHPRLFDEAPDGSFGFLQLFHQAELSGRLHGLRHDGQWYHVGTPEELEKTEQLLKKARAA